MSDYLVEWDFDVELDDTGTPRDAAMEALAAQRDPESSATVFKVTDKATGTVTVVDLGEQPAAEYSDKEYARGYDAADMAPIESIMPYPQPADEFQWGWNENIADRFPRRTCPGGYDYAGHVCDCPLGEIDRVAGQITDEHIRKER